jgi:hypothetical protein
MNFTKHGGIHINLDQVTFIDTRKEGKAIVHGGGHAFALEGDDATALLELVSPTPNTTVEPGPEAEDEPEIEDDGDPEPEPEAKPKSRRR